MVDRLSEIQLTSFLNKILHFLIHFLAVIFMFMIATELSLFYVMSDNIFCYWGSTGIFGIALFITVQMVKDFEHFQDIYDQNISNSKLDVTLNKPLNVEAEDLPLKACLLYRNGYSFQQIVNKLQLGDEAQTAKRLVVRGLDLLLKERNIKEVQTK